MLLAVLLLNAMLLQRTFALVGTVHGPDNQALPHIRVTLLDDFNSSIRTVFLDGSGRFQFRNLRPATYRVRVEPAGMEYEEQVQRVELQSFNQRSAVGEDVYNLDFLLKPRKRPEGREGLSTIFAQNVPENARAEFAKATASLKDDKPEPAIRSLQKAIEIFPDYFPALELLGREYVKTGDYKQAVEILNRAVSVNRNAPKSYYGLGVAYLNLKNVEKAVEMLDRSAEQDPTNPNTYLMLGVAYGNAQALEKSEQYLKKAYEIGKESAADAHLYLAGIYNRQGKYAEAVRELELYLREAKDIPDRSRIQKMIDSLKAKEKSKGD